MMRVRGHELYEIAEVLNRLFLKGTPYTAQVCVSKNGSFGWVASLKALSEKQGFCRGSVFTLAGAVGTGREDALDAALAKFARAGGWVESPVGGWVESSGGGLPAIPSAGSAAELELKLAALGT